MHPSILLQGLQGRAVQAPSGYQTYPSSQSLVSGTSNILTSTPPPYTTEFATTYVTVTQKTTSTVTPGHTASECQGTPSGSALTVANTKPSNAVQVPGDFIGFGFETAFLNDYANSFSENLVSSVADRLGEPVIIRIGGTSGDRVLFNPDQAEDKVCVAGDCPIGSSATYILGPSYFDGFASFPNQHMTFQAPLDPKVNYTSSLDYVQRAYNALGADRVAAIAIGNEPDDYANQMGVAYSIQDYVNAALDLEKRIEAQLGLDGTPIFEVFDLSGAGGTNGFSVTAGFQDGINSNGLVKYAAQHYYQNPTSNKIYTPATEQTVLMSHAAITARFSAGYTAAIASSTAQNVSYILSETGSSLTGPPLSWQDALGAALWSVDFQLYAMTQGVARVDSSGRPAAYHSLWVPDASANNPAYGSEYNPGPQVRAPYFASPMLADFLGKDSGAVVEVLGEETLSAYALYDSSTGALTKVAIVNLDFWSADVNSTPRPSSTLNIPVGSAVQNVSLSRLHADAGAHAQGYDVQGSAGVITWGGETWSFLLDGGEGHLVAGVVAVESLRVCAGVVSVSVPASEAVVVTF